ncbi:MAG TPA: DUF6644 family protein [Micropepsaceae bacterium]|jgi:hypothetical protein|nr:DUF6644 family protein [Micropepsaceae bacterium]
MAWLEGSALGHLMRESGVWTYAVVNLAHILGVALLFGSIVVLDLRLLGVWRRVPLAELARPTAAIAGSGLALAAMTGPGLLATKATDYIGNPFLTIKLAAISLGLVNVIVLHRLPAWKARANPDLELSYRRQLAIAGGTSLACWLTAISAGRLIAYW